MFISKLINRIDEWLFRIGTPLNNDNKYSSCFSGPMDIAVPPLEVEFMQYELVHEIGELCKIKRASRVSPESSLQQKRNQANG